MFLKTPRLAFPQGAAPGFDPAHIAATNCRFSIAGGIQPNLLNPSQKPAKTGSPTQTIFGGMGPCYANPSTSNDYLSFTGFPAVADLSGTVAGIVYATAEASNNKFFQSSGLSSTFNGVSFGYGAAGLTRLSVNNGGTSVTVISGGFLTLNVPYFLAGSYFYNGTAYVATFVILNLATGQIQTASGTTTSATSPGASTGTYIVGNSANGFNEWEGYIQAVMYAAQFMSLPQLLQWAQSPWDFWYPPKNVIYG